MNNPFATHNVEYLSPSSINLFRKDPAKWIVHVGGYKDAAYSPAMSYGIVVEKGITDAVLDHNMTIDAAYNSAMGEYARLHTQINERKVEYDFDKCGLKQDLLYDTLETIIPKYREFGVPIDTQKRVEVQLDELPIPIIGYVDLLYEDCVRDLKTTGIAPKVRSDYGRQLAFYAMATGKQPLVDFVHSTKTKKDLITFEIPVEEYFDELKRIAMKMMRLLSLSSDICEVAHLSCLEPDLTNEDFNKSWGAMEIYGANKIFMY